MKLTAALEALQNTLSSVSADVYPGASAIVDETGELRADLPEHFVSFDLVADTPDVQWDNQVRDSDVRVQVTCAAKTRTGALALLEQVDDALTPLYYRPLPAGTVSKLNGHFTVQRDFRRTR